MKAFIDKVFKKRKQDVKQLEEPTRTEDKTTEAMVEAIIEEVKKDIKKEEVKEVFAKPKHFPDCNCFKCVRWKQQNAK
jgi:hypothetical protein